MRLRQSKFASSPRQVQHEAVQSYTWFFCSQTTLFTVPSAVLAPVPFRPLRHRVMHVLAPCHKPPNQINQVLHDDFSYKPSKQPNAKSLLPTNIMEPSFFSAHFFLPFLLLAEPPADAVDATLDALDGVAELFLLDLTDLTLSSALFYKFVSNKH